MITKPLRSPLSGQPLSTIPVMEKVNHSSHFCYRNFTSLNPQTVSTQYAKDLRGNKWNKM